MCKRRPNLVPGVPPGGRWREPERYLSLGDMSRMGEVARIAAAVIAAEVWQQRTVAVVIITHLVRDGRVGGVAVLHEGRGAPIGSLAAAAQATAACLGGCRMRGGHPDRRARAAAGGMGERRL